MTNASGQSTGDEYARELSKENDKLDEVDKASMPLNLTRAFQRMRTDWLSPDRDVIESVKHAVDAAIFDQFRDAYGIMLEIYMLVREPAVTEDGEIIFNGNMPEWQRNSGGEIIENWDAINRAQRERLLYMITTRMFDWEKASADIWGEALFAKARWEEAFATGFDTVTDSKATDQRREARGKVLAADHRYLAVMKSYTSKRAEGVVRSMQGLSQRIKDISLA